jgi:hypothetical protein
MRLSSSKYLTSLMPIFEPYQQQRTRNVNRSTGIEVK